MEKNFLYISLTEFVYIRLKGVIWSSIGLAQPNNLDKISADKLTEIYNNIEKTKPLIVDCKGINSITDHAWDELFKSVVKCNRDIVFINYSQIDEKLSGAKKEFCNDNKVNQISLHYTILKEGSNFEFSENHFQLVENQISKLIKQYVAESFQKFDQGQFQRLSSTPIFASGEYDASLLISNPASFYWIVLSLLDKVERIIQLHQIGKPNSPAKILSVSLRAAPFAAAVSLLGGFQMECLNHLGPKNPYNRLENEQIRASEYIYIGDFTFGGTEIKVSKNLINFKRSALNHAITIGSLFDNDAFTEFNLHSLVLLKGLNGAANYKLFND